MYTQKIQLHILFTYDANYIDMQHQLIPLG